MIGQRIAALRRNAHMSQAALAHALGVSPSAVGMYEQGRREPPAELLVAMAEEFGVSTDFLLTGKASVIDSMDISQLLQARLEAVQRRLTRRVQSFDSQELAVLLAAMLLEP